MFLSMDTIEFGFTSWLVEIVNDCNLFPQIRLRARAKALRLRRGLKMACPKCGGKTDYRSDEDSYFYQCLECGHTFGHFIKPAFGGS